MFNFFGNKNSRKLTEAFNRALNSAVQEIIRNGDYFIVQEDGSFVLSYYRVLKHKDNTYSIIDERVKRVVYDELSLIDSAFSIVICLLHNKYEDIPTILRYDRNYLKHFMDMMHMEHSYKRAIRKNLDNVMILEDRYAIAKEKALTCKDFIRHFRSQQNFSNN